MNRDAMLARKPAVKTFDCKATGEPVTIRKLSPNETAKLNADYLKTGRDVDAGVYVFSRGVVDGEGKRVFTDADLTKIGEMDVDIVAEVAGEIITFSGLRGDAAKKPAAD